MDKVSAVLDKYNNSLSSIRGINPRFELSKGRVTESMILSELAGLRSSSLTYNQLLENLPMNYQGRSIKDIVFTDRATIASGANPIIEKVAEGGFWIDSLHDALYIYINPSIYITDRPGGRIMSLGELITHELGHFMGLSYDTSISEVIATDWGNGVAREQNLSQFPTPNQRGEGRYYNTDNIPTIFYNQARCFLAGTEIELEDGKKTNIENLCAGDKVMAFDGNIYEEKSKLFPKNVIRLFINIANNIIDLRGLFCTPGHIFLSGDTHSCYEDRFATIVSILRNNRTLVKLDGTVIRARTGAEIDTDNDLCVNVEYLDHSAAGVLGKERRVVVRAGIPMPATTLADGATMAPAGTLAGHLAAHGITILPDGSLRTSDGTHHAACNWPEGSTPFDTHEARNWIVEVDGQPYTPPWIRDLVEEDEHQGLRVVGAMPTVGGTTASPRPL